MKVSTIVSILALAAPMMIVTAKPERKRVFKIYTPEEIQAFEDNNYDGERMLQKDDKPEKTKPPKEAKPDKNEPEPAPLIAEESMSMEMTSAPSVSAVESSAPTVSVPAVVTDPPVAAIVDTPAPTEPPVVITPAPTDPPVVMTTKPPVGSFTFEPTEPPNPFAAAGNAPDAPTSR